MRAGCVHARVRVWRTGTEPPCLPQVTQLKAAAAALSPMGATELEVGLYVTEQLLAAIEHAEAHLAAIDDDETVCLATLPNVDRQPLYTPVGDVLVRRNVCGTRVWRGMQIARSDVGRARAWCASFRRRRHTACRGSAALAQRGRWRRVAAAVVRAGAARP